ncbi:LOW QUALITY PROTEIN: SWIRM domain, partial [Dillenia turbinata]
MENPGSDGSVSKRSLRKKVAIRNYDENLMDELIENHLGGALKKRIRTKVDLEKETETEAMIALSLGFPIDALLEEEIQAGVVRELGGKEQNDYIVVRNHILAKWRGNVRMWLSKGQIRETVSSEYEHLLNSAYDFLLYNGYINFGVSPVFTSQIPSEATEGSVIIVGAGLAGLAAARQLLSFGFKVVVLEGRNRPGGRVYTQKMGREGKFAAVDLGGSVITGIHANPLGVLARQLAIPLHKVRDKCPLYNPEGVLVDKEIDTRIEIIFNKLLAKVTEVRQIMGGFANDISLGSVLETLRQLYAVVRTTEERQLLDWHLANLEYANAGCLSNLSAAYWDQDDPYEMGGDHCFLAGGNWRLIKALSEKVPICYGKTVHTIRYGNEGVEVLAGSQVFQADVVLCTVPLGVLKKRAIKFEPELPERKLEAIDRLGFGLLNKVAMIFPHVFWGEDLDTFGCLRKESHRRGEFFLFYSYYTVSGGAALIALVAGEAAQSFENTDPSTLLHRVYTATRVSKCLIPFRQYVPDGVATLFLMVHILIVKSSGSDYDILAESVGSRLFFAGEATNRQYPATMHGAFLSGLREASRILQATRVQQNYSRKSIQKNIVPSNDMLEDFFQNPDLAIGKLLFIFNPLTEDPNSLGLMRVTFGEVSSDSKHDLGYTKDSENLCQKSSDQPLQLYSVLSREQAHQLQMVPGGDKTRLLYLTENLGLKLMGLTLLVQGEAEESTGFLQDNNRISIQLKYVRTVIVQHQK